MRNNFWEIFWLEKWIFGGIFSRVFFLLEKWNFGRFFRVEKRIFCGFFSWKSGFLTAIFLAEKQIFFVDYFGQKSGFLRGTFPKFFLVGKTEF